MKIYILFDFKHNQPYGGGSQFLSALRDYLNKKDMFTSFHRQSDVIIFNSHHNISKILELRLKYPDKIFIHRMGSIFTLARNDNYLDKIVMDVNDKVADGTIFQSEWQRMTYHNLGLKYKPLEIVIPNASNYSIKEQIKTNSKTRLVTTNWSTNPKKGFNIYNYIDHTLDFTKYFYGFIGNSPNKFRNIIIIPPQRPSDISNLLKLNSIFISASQHEACSNSIIEALTCNLPVIALNSGGNSEIIKKGGILCNNELEFIEAIDKVSSNLEYYKQRISVANMDTIGKEYTDFCQRILNYISPKKYTFTDYIKHNLMLKIWIIKGIFRIERRNI